MDLGGVGFDGDLLREIAEVETSVDGEFFANVEFDAGLCVALEAGGFDFDGVKADGEEGGDEGSGCVGA